MFLIIFAFLGFVFSLDVPLTVSEISKNDKPEEYSEYCYEIEGPCYKAVTENGIYLVEGENEITTQYLSGSTVDYKNIGVHNITFAGIVDSKEYTLTFDYMPTMHPFLLYFKTTETETSSSHIALNFAFTQEKCQKPAKFSLKKTGTTIEVNAFYGSYEFYVNPEDASINYMTVDYSKFLSNEIGTDKHVCLSIYEQPTNDGYINNIKYARYGKSVISNNNINIDAYGDLIKSDYETKTYVTPAYTHGPAVSTDGWTDDNLFYFELSKDENNRIIAETKDPYRFVGLEHLYCGETTIPLIATTTYITDSTLSNCRYVDGSSEHFNIEFDFEDSLSLTSKAFNFSAPSNSNLLISYKKGAGFNENSETQMANIIDVEINPNIKDNENVEKISRDSNFMVEFSYNNVKFIPRSGLIRAQGNCNDYDYLYDLSDLSYGLLKVTKNDSVNDGIVAVKLNNGITKEISYEKGLFSTNMSSSSDKMAYTPSRFDTSNTNIRDVDIVYIVFFVFVFAITLTTLIFVSLTKKIHKKEEHKLKPIR